MLISYHWLRELTATKLTPTELRERLTMVGLAIDAVEGHAGDWVLDVEVPSNRPDCLSHVGIAREVGVIEGGKLHLPPSKPPKAKGLAKILTAVEIRDAELCPRYAARLVRGVKIGPSPAWLAKRLETIGQRPINNVADITNYVLHELGQPLHAFDFQKLSGRRIVVRRAAAGEKLKTLDGVERSLDSQMLVIADAERPVALAGIMGGEESEISSATTDVLIESAYFNPESVRRTARLLGMDTEASRRFERGADPDNVLRAQQRCIELICETAGGVATEDAIDEYPRPAQTRLVSFRPRRVAALTSLQVEQPEMLRILSALGFLNQEDNKKSNQGNRKGESSGALEFAVPSWRVDVEIEEDLVEEIARHTGYDKIASELPPANVSGEYQPYEMRCRSLRLALNDAGFDEAINFSFIELDEQFAPVPAFAGKSTSENLVTLKNPIVEEASRMRSTLLPGLLSSLRHNLNHGIRDVRLFEIGRIFALFDRGELPKEREALALVATGGATEENVAQARRELDFFDLKGALESAVDAMNLGPLTFSKLRLKHLREGQAATINLSDGQEIGSIGRLSESVATAYKFRQPVYVSELDLTALLDSPEKVVQYKPLPRYPSVVRDVTLLLERGTTLGELLQVVADQRAADFRVAKLVGTYEGPNMPDGKRSVTLRIEYRSDERTLRDEEIEERQRALVDSLVKTFRAEQR